MRLLLAWCTCYWKNTVRLLTWLTIYKPYSYASLTVHTRRISFPFRRLVADVITVALWGELYYNKANLRDLIAATGLVILLKLDLNRRFFSLCDLDIWWMTPKNNRAPLLCYFQLFASFRSHWWIQTGVTVRKRLIWVKIDAFFNRATLKFDGWPSKTIGHLFYVTSSFVQHFVAIDEFKLELQSGNA